MQCYLLCGLSFTRFMERAGGIETSTTNQTFNKPYLLQIYYNTKEMSQCLVQEWLWMGSAEVMLYCALFFAFTVYYNDVLYSDYWNDTCCP